MRAGTTHHIPTSSSPHRSTPVLSATHRPSKWPQAHRTHRYSIRKRSASCSATSPKPSTPSIKPTYTRLQQRDRPAARNSAHVWHATHRHSSRKQANESGKQALRNPAEAANPPAFPLSGEHLLSPTRLQTVTTPTNFPIITPSQPKPPAPKRTLTAQINPLSTCHVHPHTHCRRLPP